MESIFAQIISALFHDKSHLELIAVSLSIAYLLLAMKENNWCWPCAFVSTAIYVYLFHHVFLFMDAALHIYYMAMAIYGFWTWRHIKNNGAENGQQIQYWPLSKHLLTLLFVALATAISGYLLDTNTEAAWPYVDSFTTWASVITTYMVAKKVIENWLYWIVIDSVAMALYIDRGLYFTAMLFMCYVIIVIFGFFSWRKKFINENMPMATA